MRTRDAVMALALTAALFLVWPFVSRAVAQALIDTHQTLTGGAPSQLSRAALTRQNAQYLLPVLAVVLVGFGAPWRRRLVFAGVLVGGYLAYQVFVVFAPLHRWLAASPDFATHPLQSLATILVFHTFDVVFGFALLLVFVAGAREHGPGD